MIELLSYVFYIYLFSKYFASLRQNCFCSFPFRGWTTISNKDGSRNNHFREVWKFRCPHNVRGIWNGGFALKTHQMFPVRITPEKFENVIITGHFGIVFEETSVREIRGLIIAVSSFLKSSVFKMFSFHTKTLSRRFQIPLVWRTFFRKATFSWRVSVDGRPCWRNKNSYFKLSVV